MAALQQFPAVNAVIDGDDIIYRDYIDISIAVGTKKVSKWLCQISEWQPGVQLSYVNVRIAGTRGACP